jgi:hypothetical protein
MIIQYTKEGAYIQFALSKSVAINSTIKSYLTTLKLINVILSITQYKCPSLHHLINVWRTNYQIELKKKLAGSSSCLFLAPRAGSLDEVWMLLHHTPRLKRFHGLLSMSSYTVCPCFCITASVSQLASSTG